MATFYPVGGGASGIDPTVLTATAGDVVSGAVAGVKDNYNPVVGTLTLTGNAQANHVLSGETYYTTNPKLKITGTMTVQSVLSFSSAPYSSNQIIFTWQNPQFGPFSGVIIVGKTGGYPANINDGTRYYKGFGNNNNSLGISSVTISGFNINVTYYFRVFGYCTINSAESVTSSSLISNTIIQQLTQTFTSSTSWTVPSGVYFIDIFCVGGGGGGGNGSSQLSSSSQTNAGGGGGGGYTKNVFSLSVTPSESLNIIIGSGGVGGSLETGGNGGNSIVKRGTTNLCIANGGYGGSSGQFGDGGRGGNGGSGAGGGSYITQGWTYGGNGGSNGSNGIDRGAQNVGTGQGSTTRSFNNTSGTIYSGGGGGGGRTSSISPESSQYPGSGGVYGGGDGGISAGTSNSGGGGGGGMQALSTDSTRLGKSGGSGICIIRYVK